jgi:hypothetical protein
MDLDRIKSLITKRMVELLSDRRAAAVLDLPE